MAISSSSPTCCPTIRPQARRASRACSRVDERMVVPAGAVVKVITTSNDVIHCFAVPAFWVKMDAVPGRLNETWFKVDRPGVYFGHAPSCAAPATASCRSRSKWSAASAVRRSGSPRRAATCPARQPAAPTPSRRAAGDRRRDRKARPSTPGSRPTSSPATETPADARIKARPDKAAETDMTDTTANAVHFEAAPRP